MVSTLLTGIVRAFDFNGDVVDSTGNGTATNNGADLTTNDGVIGKCATFDGVNDYISLGDLSALGVKSISFWGYVDSTGSFDGNTPFFSDIQTSAPTNFTIARIYSNTNNIIFQRSGDWSTGSVTRIYNTFVNYILTIDGSNMRLYINGVFDKEIVAADNKFFILSEILELGREKFTPSYSKVRLNMFYLWTKTLTDGGVSVTQTAGGEIAELYNSGAGNQYPFGVAAKNLSLGFGGGI